MTEPTSMTTAPWLGRGGIGAAMDLVRRPLARPHFTRTLPRCPESARAARLLVTAALSTWGLDGIEDAGHLVITELVSNAARHAVKRSLLVSVTLLDAGLVRIAVVDLSEVPPELRCAGPDALDGRGLAIVDEVSHHRWGVEPMRWGCRRGKRVWADLELEVQP